MENRDDAIPLHNYEMQVIDIQLYGVPFVVQFINHNTTKTALSDPEIEVFSVGVRQSDKTVFCVNNLLEVCLTTDGVGWFGVIQQAVALRIQERLP